MKRYKFRFEPLLFQRQTREEQVQQELARESRLLLDYQDELTRLYDDYRKHRLAADLATFTAADLIVFNTYANHLLDLIEAAKARVREQRKVVEEMQRKLMKVHQEKRVVETIKEKDRLRHADEARRQESRQIDELNVVRHANPSTKKG